MTHELHTEMRAFAIPDTRYGLIVTLLDCAVYLSLIVGTMISEPWGMRLLFSVLAALTVSPLFILGHDAAHGALTCNQLLNRLLARIVFLPSLHNYSLWKVQHNRLHHHLPNVQNLNSWSPLSPAEYNALPPWRRALERLYRSGAGFGIYYTIERWWKDKFSPTVRSTHDSPPRSSMPLGAISPC